MILEVVFAAFMAFFALVWLLMIRRVVIFRPRFATAFAATVAGLFILWLDGRLAAVAAVLYMAGLAWLMVRMFRRIIAPLPGRGPDDPDPPWSASPRLPPEG